MNFAYCLSQGVAAIVDDVFFHGDTIGVEHLPPHGPFLMAVNHCSHLDPPLLGCRVAHPMHFFGRKTLWKPGFASWWLDTVGSHPVDRDGADLGAMKRTLGALEGGEAVILFPEGTRSPNGQLQPAKPGVGMMACRTQVPVVPARIFGSFQAFGRDDRMPRPYPVSVVVGPPLPPAAYDDPAAGRLRYQVASERILAAIAALQEPCYPPI